MHHTTRHHTLRLFYVLLIVLALSAVLAACRQTDGPDTSSGTGTAAGTAEPGVDTAPGTDTQAGSGEDETEAATDPADSFRDMAMIYPPAEAGAASGTVLSVADFGAKGDGVTDDGPAVSAAVRAAVEQHATLTFEAGKTYCIGTSDTTVGNQTGPLVLSGASGVRIDGQGATLKVTPGLAYFALLDCTDVRISGLTFDYSVPVYMVGTVTKMRGNTVYFSTDIQPNMDEYDFARVNGFSIKYNEGLQQRPHAFIGQMRKTGDNTVSVIYTGSAPYTVGDKVFLPNPGVGHAFNAPVEIRGCTGAVVCDDVNIRAASTMSVVVSGNEAEIWFLNTDLMPDVDDGRGIHMVGWRDGFHCSDNRLPIHWVGCDVGVMFDDAFNIYGALGYITAVNDDNTLTACHYGRYLAGSFENIDIRAGDVLDFYNNVIGEYYGSATVREVVQNGNGTTSVRFEYGDDVRSVPVGAQIANRSTGAPGSTFDDCRLEGTFRFHRGLRFTDTRFDVLCMWIMVEDNGEGPLPGCIDFINCTLSGPPQIDCMNRASNKYFTNLGSHITDIAFGGCTMEGKLRTRSGCTWIISDTPGDRFTDVYYTKKAVTPVDISPADYDFLPGVFYDWTHYSMPVTGAETVPAADVTNEPLRAAMQGSDGFAQNALRMKGGTLTLDGLSGDRLPCLYRAGNRYTVTVTVCADKDGTAVLKAGGYTSAPVSFAAGKAGTLTFAYVGDGRPGSLSIDFAGGGTVYVGTVRVTMAVNKDPSTEQLLYGHTFVWTDEVRFDGCTAMPLDEAPDAVKAAQAGFTTGTVLRLSDRPGSFTGLTDASYFAEGKAYRITLDAYAAKAAQGAAIRLAAQDKSGNVRVLAEAHPTGAGQFRLEADWTVGAGETALTLVTDGAVKGSDVWLGDFTVTEKLSYKPDHFLDVWLTAWPTAEEFRKGHRFDFADGNLMDFGYGWDFYASTGSFNDIVTARLRAAGFGERVFWVDRGFHLHSIEQMHPGGHRVTITLDVYDARGNLTEPGTLSLRPMLNGEDTGAWLDYTVEADPNDPQHLWLTFTADLTTDDTIRTTEDIVIFPNTEVEYIIGYVDVVMDQE